MGRYMAMVVAVGFVLTGLTIDPVPMSWAAPAKATQVRGFELRDTVQPGEVVRDRFKVTGPLRRPVVLQHREPGQRWTKVQRARTTNQGKALVRLTVSRAGGVWVWKARLQNRRWVTLARTSSTTHELRIKVPRRQGFKPAVSSIERVRVVTPAGAVEAPPPPAASLGLPTEPREGGDGLPSDYWAQFPKAQAAGWTDPSFFPFASFFVPYHDARQYASYGINVAMNVEASGSDIGAVTDHMWVLAGDEWWNNPSANSDPRVVGWHTLDEQEMSGDTFADYKADVDTLRAKNDGRFIQTNFGNGVLDSYWPDSSQKPFEQWVEYTDAPSVDKYAYTSPHIYDYLFPDLADRWPDGANAQSSAAYYWQAREMGSYFQDPPWARPVWVFVEVARPFLTERGASVITPQHMEGAVWGAIIGGARGIAWFDHSNDSACGGRAFRDCPIQREAAVEIMRDVKSLAAVINQPTVVWDFQAGQINTMAKEYRGYLYIFAQPSTYPKLGTATFTLPDAVGGTEVEVVNENRNLSVRDGAFSDEFQAEYTHHVYRVAIN